MKKLMVAIAAAAISFAGFADDTNNWFTAGFGAEALSSGGAWSPAASSLTWGDENVLVLEDVGADAPVKFAAEEAKAGAATNADSTVVFDTTVTFQGFEDLPTIEDGAKAGVCALTDGNYYVVAYDDVGSTNKWVDTGFKAAFDVAVNVKVTVANGKAVYTFTDQFGTDGTDPLDLVDAEFQEVCYSGNGSVTTLAADTILAGVAITLPEVPAGITASCEQSRAAEGDTVTVYFAYDGKFPSVPSADYSVGADGSLTLVDGQPQVEALDPGAKIGTVFYLTFNDAYEAAIEDDEYPITLCTDQYLESDIEKSITIDLAGNDLTVTNAVAINGVEVVFDDSAEEVKGKLVLEAALSVADGDTTLDIADIDFECDGGYLTGVGGIISVSEDLVSANKMLAEGSFGEEPEDLSVIVYVGDSVYSGAGDRFAIEGEVAYATVGEEDSQYIESFASVQAAIEAANEVYLCFGISGVEYPEEDITFADGKIVYAEVTYGEDALANCTLLPEGEVEFDGSCGDYGAWVYSGEPPTPTYYEVTFSTNDVKVVEAATTVEAGKTLDSEQVPKFEEEGTWDVDPLSAVITCDTNFNYTIAAPVPTYTLTFPLRNEGVHALVTNLTTGAFWNFDGPSTNSVVVEKGSFVTEILSSTKPGYEASGTTISWTDIKRDIEFPEFEARPIKYTITYNGANVTNGVFEYTIETETFALPKAVDVEAMPGGQFKGWTNELGVAKNQVEKGTTGDLTFYAVWEAAGVFYPTYIDQDDADLKKKFNDWATNFNDGDRDGASANIDAFLLNCAPADVETAKTAFKIISITKTEDGWVCKVAGEKGEGAEYGNGYVHFVSVKEKFGSDGTSSDFFQATLTLENPATE